MVSAIPLPMAAAVFRPGVRRSANHRATLSSQGSTTGLERLSDEPAHGQHREQEEDPRDDEGPDDVAS